MKITLGVVLLFVSTHSMAAPCDTRGTSVVVNLDTSTLWLCADNKVDKQYRVALGSGGVDKRVQGDKKTPVGTYSLSNGRRSSKYHRFIPVGYPTKTQVSQGYTGKHIGIHGPKRGYTWLGPLGTMVNWTQGCIAVATDAQIEEIVAWVKQSRARKIHLISEKQPQAFP